MLIWGLHYPSCCPNVTAVQICYKNLLVQGLTGMDTWVKLALFQEERL